MKKSMGNKYFIAVWAIIVLVFHLTLFLLVKEANLKSVSFWTTFVFIDIAFVVYLLSGLLMRSKQTRGIFAGTTIASVFLVIVLVMGSIFFFFPKMAFLAVFLPLLIISGIFAILLVISCKYNESVSRHPQKHPEILQMDELAPYLEHLQKNAKDSNVFRALTSLIAKAKKATAIANPDEHLIALEKRIYEYASFVYKNIENGEMSNVYNNMERLGNLLDQREQRLEK